MTVEVYGVTADAVRRHHFPQLASFADDTAPTETTVDEMVDAAGARLAGKLGLKSVTVDVTDTTSPAYAWCADTIRLDVACRIPPTQSGIDPDEYKRRLDELKERYKELSEGGADALGEGASADETDSEPEGPVTHLTENSSIELQDSTDASDSIPRLRYDDEI
jgi:hypothetical protein